MRRKKIYGEYKTDLCPFCGKQAFTRNKVKLAVCKDHADTEYPSLKCQCGAWFEVLSGKYGNYCNCLRCGNVSMDKALAMQGKNSLYKTQKQILRDPVEEKAKKLGIKSWKDL